MTDKYRSASAQRLLQVIECLVGNELQGLRPGELAKAVGCAPAMMTRDLANLEIAGWVQKIDSTNAWRLTPRVAAFSRTVSENLRRARIQLDETELRYSRIN